MARNIPKEPTTSQTIHALLTDPSLDRYKVTLNNDQVQTIIAKAFKAAGVELKGALWCWFNRGEGPELLIVRSGGDT